MSRYKVTIDTSYGNVRGYREIVLDADSPAQAKYLVSKTVCCHEDLGMFFRLCSPTVEKVPDTTPLWTKQYDDDNPDGIFKVIDIRKTVL